MKKEKPLKSGFTVAYVVAFSTILFAGTARGGDTPAIGSYAEGSVQSPRYRTWTGVGWGAELTANSVGGRIRWVVLRAHPNNAEAILGVLDAKGHVNVQVWDGDSWGTPLELTTAISPGNSGYRGFDIAYEQSSGDVVTVYSTGQNDPEYRVWNGSAWSDPDKIDLPAGGRVRWVKLLPKPSSDTMMLVTLHQGNNVSAAIWDGSQFGDSIRLEPSAPYSTYELIDAAWEGSSGSCLVVWGEREGDEGYIGYNTWDGSQWGSPALGPSLGEDYFPLYLRLAPKPVSDTILLAVSYDNTGWSPYRLKANLWDGSGWGNYTAIESGGMEAGDRRCFDMVFESSGDQAILGWSDRGIHTLDYRTWTSGTGWSPELTGPNLGNDIQLVQLRADPNSDEITLVTVTDDRNLQGSLWTGSAWSVLGTAENNIATLQHEPYMVAYRTGAVTWTWVYPTSGSIGAVYSSPTIRGGRVYVGSDDTRFYCFNACDGSLIWTYTAGDTIRSSPSAAYESGGWVIYFSSNGGWVYALKDTGLSYEEKWTKNLGAVVGSSPALWDSLLYVGSNDDSIHCLRMSDGSQKWATYLYGDISSSPAVFNDVVYTGSKSDTLYALDHLDGTILRRYRTCGDVVAPVFLTWGTGRLCIGSCASATQGSDTMYIIDSSNFSTYWKFADSGNLARIYTSAFTLAGRDSLYFGSDNNYLYCVVLSTKTLSYKYDTSDDVRSSPLYWDGAVYLGSNNNAFYGLDDSAQKPKSTWPFFTNGDVESSPAISLTSNIVVVGSSDGHVYMFHLE